MKIGVAGWSIHRRFFNKEVALLDYPALCKEEFGVSGVELNSPFFESTEDDYLDQLMANADKAGVKLIHISVDAPGNLASLDEEERQATVAEHLKWGRIAGKLGCISYRANTGGSAEAPDDEMAACIKSWTELCADAAPRGVKVIIENHGGIAKYPDPIIRLIEAAGRDRAGACPDFGNWTEDVRYEATARMAPYAVVMHAKFHDFDEQGNHPAWDIARCVQLCKDGGFDGWYLIEFEGQKDDHEGVLRAIELLKALA